MLLRESFKKGYTMKANRKITSPIVSIQAIIELT